jgi:pimeloyl-ACP methyl ester carboxylesterase
MAEPAVEFVERDGGRRMAVHRIAEGDTGRTVVLCHAAPGSGEFDPDPEQTWTRGVTLLSVDRPGYGQSDPVPDGEWASVGGAADDLAVVIERLGGGSAGVAGWSAGGRVALALAARRPDLVDRVVLIGTPAPHSEVPWIPVEQQAVLDQLRGLIPQEVHAILGRQLAPLIPADVSAPEALGMLGASPADDKALALPDARQRLARMLAGAFAQGAVGLAGDIAGYTLQSWGFEFSAVQAKTLLLYGSRDPIAGQKHGVWWQKQLSDARLEVVPGAGRLLILPMWQRALSHLAPGAKRGKAIR